MKDAPASAATPHPAILKAQLRTLIALDRAVTTVQLRRWGLLDAATWLRLPQVTYTVRTRTTQRASAVTLTFVCADTEIAAQASRELMHYAGLAEARRHTNLHKLPELRWRHIDERRAASRGDAEIVGPPGRFGRDTGVEFDAGYSTAVVQKKLEACVDEGYAGLIWATSSLGRASNIHRQFVALEEKGLLRMAHILYVNFWDEGDPYKLSPRNHKAAKLTWKAEAT